MSTSPAVFTASFSFTQGWFHYKRSAGAKAPFQVKMSNLSSVEKKKTLCKLLMGNSRGMRQNVEGMDYCMIKNEAVWDNVTLSQTTNKAKFT